MMKGSLYIANMTQLLIYMYICTINTVLAFKPHITSKSAVQSVAYNILINIQQTAFVSIHVIIT